MKKKFSSMILICVMLFCLFTPNIQAFAASGKTTIAVSSKTVNIGDSVTVTARAFGASGETAYASMVLSYDAGILEFVSCTATYGGGGGSISVANDSFSVTFKAIAAGKASLSLSATDGVIFSTAEELDSMEGSGTSITVNNAAGSDNTPTEGGNQGNNETNNGGTAGETTTPTKSQSADNSLKTLTISPGTLSPEFKGSTTKYTATVEHSVTSIAVSAIPVNEKATVESVTGNTNLEVGTNVIQVVVKAENGTTATYKIIVTRQEKAAEQPSTPNTPAEETKPPQEEQPDDTNTSSDPDGETETEQESTEATNVTGDIFVYNTAYQISEDFLPEQIPAGFLETMINFRGTEYKGLSSEGGTVSLLYMEMENGESATGKFFVYDTTRDTLYDFVKMAANESSSVIALLAPLDSVLPDSYVQTSLQLSEDRQMTAYQLSDDVSGFYLFYGMNQEGLENWYQYDVIEGTYQRLNGSITDLAETENETDNDFALEEYETMLKKYEEEKAALKNAVYILVFLLAAAVIFLFNLICFGRKKKTVKGQTEDVTDSFGKENDPKNAWDEEEEEFGSNVTKEKKEKKEKKKPHKKPKRRKVTKDDLEEIEEEDDVEVPKQKKSFFGKAHTLKAGKEEEFEIEQSEEEDVQEEEKKEEKKLKKEKKNETSVKNEKDVDVWDLNDL